MNITNMKITDIRPYDKNPRINDDAVEAVAKSLKEFGWQQPIVVDKDHVIIVGHTRLKAAESLGLTEVPVVVADHLTPEQVQAYRIADNKTGEIAEWDYNLLPVELKDLQKNNAEVVKLVDDAIKCIRDNGLTTKDRKAVALLDFLADLESNPYGMIDAVADYSFAFSATCQQCVNKIMQKQVQ